MRTGSISIHVPPGNIKVAGVNWPSALPHLHGSVDCRVCSQAEVGAGHVVADGRRDHTHGDAELVVAAPGFKQLQHALVAL